MTWWMKNGLPAVSAAIRSASSGATSVPVISRAISAMSPAVRPRSRTRSTLLSRGSAPSTARSGWSPPTSSSRNVPSTSTGVRTVSRARCRTAAKVPASAHWRSSRTRSTGDVADSSVTKRPIVTRTRRSPLCGIDRLVAGAEPVTGGGASRRQHRKHLVAGLGTNKERVVAVPASEVAGDGVCHRAVRCGPGSVDGASPQHEDAFRRGGAGDLVGRRCLADAGFADQHHHAAGRVGAQSSDAAEDVVDLIRAPDEDLGLFGSPLVERQQLRWGPCGEQLEHPLRLAERPQAVLAEVGDLNFADAVRS